MLKNNKGIAMVVIVCTVLILLIIGASALLIANAHTSTSYMALKRARAQYTAEAALQYVLYRLRTGAITPPVANVPFPETINNISPANIDIDVSPLDAKGVYPINITVTY